MLIKLLVSSIIFLLTVSCASLNTEVKRPNVIIFLTDDQGTLDVNCFGAKDLQTPAIDRLAANGVKFTQAYSHIVCCPARALLLTGRHPQRSGIVNWTQNGRNQADGINLPLSEYTLAEVLKDNGYKTALFGKWHLGAKKGFGPMDQGFETFHGHLGGFIENYRHFFMHNSGFHDLYEQDEEIFREGKYFPEMMTSRAMEYVEKNKNQPFFMMVSFNIPHYPEQPSEKFKNAYADLASPRKEYARMISTVDDYIGQINKKVADLGLTENTIILYYSDNGHSTEDAAVRVDNHSSGFPKGFNYGPNGGGGYTGKWLGQKGDYREGGIRVPAILSYPAKLSKGIERDQAVIGADWYPTILDLCGIKLPEVKLDGESVVPVIKDNSLKSPHEMMFWNWGKSGAVRKGEWKLILHDGKENALHNLNDEKPESKNYVLDKSSLVEELKEKYQQWLKETAK